MRFNQGQIVYECVYAICNMHCTNQFIFYDFFRKIAGARVICNLCDASQTELLQRIAIA